MTNALFRHIVGLLLLVFGGAAMAQTPVIQLQAELVSPWLVTVDGEARQRSLKILGLAEKAKDTFLIEATYGWLGGDQDPALAEITLSGTERKLKITTSAQSVILATQSTDGSFSGTFKTRTGAEKPIRLEKISEPDFQAKVLAAKTAAANQAFANEDKDWGVAATTTPRRGTYHAPTPTTVPGAKVIKTMALKALLDENQALVVIDVLDGNPTIPGAHWMKGGGEAPFYASEKSRFASALEKLTASDKKRPLVFSCLSSECWLSYNAALYALDAGYTDVTWYRGGVVAWKAAGLPVKKPEGVAW